MMKSKNHERVMNQRSTISYMKERVSERVGLICDSEEHMVCKVLENEERVKI